MHIENIHSKYPEPCDNRGNAASSNTEMKVHNIKSQSEPCDNRDNTANSNLDIGVHIENTHSDYPEPCDNCGNAACNNTDMKVHSTNIHSDPCYNSGSTSNAKVVIGVHSINTHSVVAAPCDKCGDAVTCNCDLKVHSNKNHDNTTKWTDYDGEFKITVDSILEKLTNKEVTPAEAAIMFTNKLSEFLESKPDIIKEVNKFYKHKPKSTKDLDDARKLKNSLLKEAKKKGATEEDKSTACGALRQYDHILKEHKESLKAIEIRKQEKEYRNNFHRFAKEITNGTFNQPKVNPSYSLDAGNLFYKENTQIL